MRKNILLIQLVFSWVLIQAQTNNWTQVGLIEFPHNNSGQTTGMGRICNVVFHPTDSNIVYAISSQGGLWRSMNGGVSWSATTDQFPRSKFASLGINHKNPSTMYIGTGDPNAGGGGAGIWKTVNGGQTWFLRNKGIEKEQIYSIIIHQNDTNQLVALSRQGVYKSYDGGANWVRKTTKVGSQDMIRKAGTLRGLYYCSAKDFSYSNDFGETWTTNELISGDTMGGILICSSNLDSNLVYALAWRTNSWGTKTHFGGLFKSKDGGKNWALQSDRPQIMGYSNAGATDDGQGRYNMAIAVDPMDAGHVFVGAINLWESKDSGKTWTLNSKWGTGIHADKHFLGYSPHHSAKLFVSHDGGIDLSRNSGASWENASNFLAVTEFYSFAQSPAKKELMVGGTQDNGKYFYMDSIFYNTGAGDVLLDFTFPDKDSLYIYSNGTDKRYQVYDQKYYSMNGIISNATFEQNRKNKSILYMCDKDLYRTLDINAATIAWVKLSNPTKHYGTVGTVDVEACKSNPDLLYWGKTNNVLYLIRNVNSANPSFTQVTIPAGTLSQITTHASDSNLVYITVNNILYRSGDKGNTWQSIQYNLPANPIVKFLLDDKMTDSSMYVCTAFEVYYRNKNMNSWLSIQGNRPTISLITDMEIYNDSSRNSCIRVSTYGRGIWQTGLKQFQNSPPKADFTFQRLGTDCPDILDLNDVSLGSQYKRRWQILPYGAYTYQNGTDSNSAIPEVVLNQRGDYWVTLYVENAYGSDSLTKVFHFMKQKTYAGCNVYTKSYSNLGYGISAFEFTDINTQTPYTLQVPMNTENLTCGDYAHVKPGATYNTAVSNKGYYSEYASLFIDYNDDGDFNDADERVYDYPSGLGRRTGSVSIISKPPVTGKLIRMRVISDNSRIKSACDTVRYGQAEDYLILIDTSVVVSLDLPKPRVYGQFKASIHLSSYCPKFDVSKLKLTNATLLSCERINPFKFELTLSPKKPGRIWLELQPGALVDKVQNTHWSIGDSTLFEIGLTSFTFPGITKQTQIVQNDTGGVVNCYVYHGVGRGNLKATFSLTDSCNAFVNQQLQVSAVTVNNFNAPVLFEVRNLKGDFKKSYQINVIELPDTVCELLSFEFRQPNVSASINANLVHLKVPYGTDLSNRAAFTSVSPGAKIKVNYIDEISGLVLHDFRLPLVYRVYAEDTMYHKDYVVSTEVLKNEACELIDWAIQTPAVSGTILPVDTALALVHAVVPFGTSMTQLTSVFKLSDSAQMYINQQLQISGVSQNDYSDTVKAVVVSQDGRHFKTYKIIVSKALNDACQLISYDLPQHKVIGNVMDKGSESWVLLSLPYRVSKDALVATFVLSDSARLFINQTQQLSGISSHSYKDTLNARVLAQDGLHSKDYRIVTFYALNDSCEMNSFSILSPAATGIFTRDNTGGTVAVNVPPHTDLSKLVAGFTLSDSAIAEVTGVRQVSGSSVNDFASEVTYKVWSQSKKFSKEYKVTVSVLSSLDESKANGFEVYPNPASDYALLQIPANLEDYEVKVIDNSGKVLMVLSNVTQLDIKDLKAGIYTVQLMAQGTVWTGKLVKK